jgi:sodium-dependent dicarboxylate transporter 2/3/5
MAIRDHIESIWAKRTWLEIAARPVLVDYSGLKVRRAPWKVMAGHAGHRPIVLLLAALFILAVLILPVPGSLINMVEQVNPSGYDMQGPNSQTIVDSVNYSNNTKAFQSSQERSGAAAKAPDMDSSKEVARRAMIMLAILVVAALLWGTEGLPIGGTVALVAVLMFVFRILPPNDIAKAFMNDAVIFILGILVVAVGVSRTGLDKRIGLLLLSPIKGTGAFAFIFFPILAISSAFLSAHALVAILVPVMMGIYKATCAAQGVERDRVLAVFLFLGLSFAANIGGPGSPAAGARNAIMIGFFADAGLPIGFWEWMKYGMPLVPVLALVVGAYMYLRCKRNFTVKTLNPSEVVRREVKNLPKFGGKEAVMAAVLGVLVIGWMTLHESLGMGGVTVAAVCALFLFRITSWDDIQHGVAFDVVGLYAAASAIAVGLSFTGGGLWLATQTIEMLPDFMNQGNGLVMGVSLMTVTLTNFMSDGATVGALGPLALPMAELGNVSVWKVGLMVSFASSFANVLVVGTPNNAIVFSMCKDPHTGKRLLSVFDFVKYGLPLTVLLMLVTWGWALFGYWTFLSWP